MAKRGAQMADGFTMGAQRRGTLGGHRCEAQHRGAVAGVVGVMDQAGDRDLAVALLQEHRQRAGMKVLALGQRHAVLDRTPRDFVPEAQRTIAMGDHSDIQAFLHDLAAGADHAVDQPALGVSGHDGNQVRHPARLAGQPCQARNHRIAHRRRHLVLRCGEDFGDEERIAAGHLVQAGRRSAGRRGQQTDRIFAQRLQPDAAERCRRQVADDRAQRMLVGHLVVAIADHQHHREPGQATAEELDQVECRFVRPVCILDDHHRRRRQARELIEGRVEDLLPAGRRADHPREFTADLAGNVLQRRQGMRREQRLAAAPQHAVGPALRSGKLAKKRRLADAGLAGNQRHTTSAARNAIELGAQLLDIRLTLKQLHSRLPDMLRKECKGFDDDGDCSEASAIPTPARSCEMTMDRRRGQRRGAC